MPDDTTHPPAELPDIKPDDAAPAWLLLVEVKTRIATQPLHYRTGDEETALASLHEFFPTTRTLLAAHPRAAAFDAASLFLINQLLCPNTARWHQWLVGGKFRDEISRRRFRLELLKLQPHLLRFEALLDLLVAGPGKNAQAKEHFAELRYQARRKKLASLGGPVKAGIGPEIEFKNDETAAQRVVVEDMEHPTTHIPGRSFVRRQTEDPTTEHAEHPATRFPGLRFAGQGFEVPKPENDGEKARREERAPATAPAAVLKQPFATRAEINAKEGGFIQRRRNALNGVVPPREETEPVFNASGICLSGGGIRSATFSLGIVQVLQRHGLLAQFDYLSTVSGGSYLGSFLSSFLGTFPAADTRAPDNHSYDRKTIDRAYAAAFDTRDGRESDAVRHLRNNSRYLLNGGTWARVRIIGLLITGVLTNLLLMLPLSLVAVLEVNLLDQFGYWGGRQGRVAAGGMATTPAFVVFEWLVLVLAGFWLALPVVRNCARGATPLSFRAGARTFWETGALLLGLFSVAAGLLVLLPWGFHLVSAVRGGGRFLESTLGRFVKIDTLVAAISGVAPVVLGLLAAPRKANANAWVTQLLFTLSGPLFYLVIFFFVGSRVLDGIWDAFYLSIITAALLCWSWLFVDINDFSPHGYYRARLCECYLAARDINQTSLVRRWYKRFVNGREQNETFQKSGIGKLQQLPLSQMNATGAVPYHLVNAAVNLPASHEPNLRGRDCDFFTFSRYYCGGPVCGYVETKTLESLDPHVDLGSAMAISGAAASSNMGVRTMRQLRFLLTLLNVRLGYWMRNPLYGVRRPWNQPGPQYLFREMTGWMHEKSGYLNLSDGGHIENLALYELLRRRCKFIVVIDGGMEPGMECADLRLAQRYAQIDLGTEFELDLTDLTLNDLRLSRAYAVCGRICYGGMLNDSRPGDIGWLLYIKLARTGGEPGYVLDYERQNPDFPHQTTGNQLYDEAQFEAYRRLGEVAAESLFREEIFRAYAVAGGKDGLEPATLEEWFRALVTNLLPDNDVAFDPLPDEVLPEGSAAIPDAPPPEL